MAEYWMSEPVVTYLTAEHHCLLTLPNYTFLMTKANVYVNNLPILIT